MTLSDIINLASAQVGYTEKRSNNSNLDVMEGDGALGNYTKYARDLKAAEYYGNKNKNGYNWCAVFIDWLVLKCCGDKVSAEAHKPNGTYGASCTWTKKYYKSAGLLGSEPKEGAQIFFKDKAGDPYHTGLVVAVTDTQIVVIEGNTSKGKVERKTYARNYKYIDSYGYIKYDAPVPEPVELFKAGDKVKLLSEYYSNGKHIAKSVRNRAFLYVISDNGTIVKVSKHANLAYTGAVKKSDLVLYE